MLNNKNINFLKISKKLNIITIICIIIGLGSIIFKGLQPALEFTGGFSTRIETTNMTIQELDIRKALEQATNEQMQVVNIKSSGKESLVTKAFLIETQSTNGKLIKKTLRDIDKNIIVGEFSTQEAHIGKELAFKTLYAFLLALLIIGIYVTIRFDRHYAIGSLVALFHDVLFTMGILSLLNIQLSLSIVAAILTIIGYSLNDTIVVYDRIRENVLKLDSDKFEIVNISLNQILNRTIITSLTTLFVVVVLYFFGGDILEPFATTLIIGVAIGTYSSIFIASPVMIYLGNKFPIKELNEDELTENI